MSLDRDERLLQSLKYLNNNLHAFQPGDSAADDEIAGELAALRRNLAPTVVQKRVAKKPQTNPATVSERVDGILTNFDNDPMSEEDVLAVLRGHMMANKAHAEAEDISLSILCHGYVQGSTESYAEALSQATCANLHALGHYRKIKQRSSVMDQVADAGERIQERHEHISDLGGDVQAGGWTLHVMRQIEALKFAIDWARLSGPGSSLIKRRFYQDTFCAHEHFCFLVEDLSEDERAEALHKNGELGTIFSQWKRTNERLVTGRNRLLTLYNLFGATVLIDPLWTVETLGIKCSRTFGRVLDEIVSRMTDNPQPFLQQQRRGKCVLVRIANAVEPNDNFMSYVIDFVTTNPPK